MKECKIININDYLKEGWEVKAVVPIVNPAIQEKGSFSFYRGGLEFYLEREVKES